MPGLLDAWLDLAHGSTCVGCARAGRVLCERCRRSLPVRAAPVRPTPCPSGLAACFATGEYAGLLRAMVLAHKEQSAFALARPLGVLLAAAVVAAGRAHPQARLLLVPIPATRPVVRQRGHDPLWRITTTAARQLRTNREVLVRRLLSTTGPARDQSGLSTPERAANLAGTMQVRPGARRVLAAAGRPVLLVLCDDVLTTGATAREAQRALETAGVRVHAVATIAATRKRVPPRPTTRRGTSRGPTSLPLSAIAD